MVTSQNQRKAGMKVFVVLPAYNEALALPPLIDSLVDQLEDENRVYQILIVNDGSTDDTQKVVEEQSKSRPIVLINNEQNRGLAETVKRGLLEAVKRADASDVIITMDADNTHPAGLMIRMLRLIREGNDVVIASRYREGSYIKGLAWHRKFLSVVAGLLFRVFFPTPGVKDYTCGYRAYRVKVLQEIMAKYGDQFISEKGFSCMVDVLLRLRETDAIFSEVPLILRYDLKPGRSKMQVFRTVVETLKLLVRRRLSS